MTRVHGPAGDSRLGTLRQQVEHEAGFRQVFLVLTVGATLIATLGLLANSPSWRWRSRCWGC